jgi:hypothetical protein
MPRHRWEDNIKMHLRDIGRGGTYWIDLVKGSCEHGNEPSDFLICWEILEWLSSWQFLKHGSAQGDNNNNNNNINMAKNVNLSL